MAREITIGARKGLFTNANPEDIAPGFDQTLRNLRIVNGKLAKTYGIGKRIDTALAVTPDNLATFIHASLTAPAGYKFFAVDVNATTKILTVYAWDSVSPAWTDIKSYSAPFVISSEFVFQSNAKNPIITGGDSIRLLPGNTGKVTQAITTANTADDYFKIAGDFHTPFTAGQLFAVEGSTGNDGVYMVSSSSFGSGATQINVNTATKAVASATADGAIVWATSFDLYAKGFWLGWIDRDFFDDLYTPTACYYGYPNEIEAPDIDFTATLIAGGDYSHGSTVDDRQYRFSYVYDGIQESLLSDDAVTIRFTTDTFLQLAFSIVYADHNKRITSMKVYRASDGVTFKHIHTIDFLRPSGSADSYTSGAYAGPVSFYVPALATYIFNPNALATQYEIWVDDGVTRTFDVTDIDGTELEGLGKTLFQLRTGETEIAGDRWNKDWKLYLKKQNITSVRDSTGSAEFRSVGHSLAANDAVVISDSTEASYNGVGTVTSVSAEYFVLNGLSYAGDATAKFTWDSTIGTRTALATGTGGSYSGTKTINITQEIGPGTLVDAVFSFVTLGQNIRLITANLAHAVYFDDALTGSLTSETNEDWGVFTPAGGMYAFTDGTTQADGVFYDTGITDGAAHPIDGEVSIAINGKFARVISERLWQGNIVMDPGNTAEAHVDWVSYSELGQYDVNPVSNVIRLTDREGGEITGLAEIFGNPVVLKKQAIIPIGTKGQTPPYAAIESAHNIGNLATQGYIEVAGNLYVCWTDGIYRLRPNNLAATDSTPTESLKITEPVENIYLALSQANKEAITVGFNPLYGEIVWTLGSAVYAFDIETDSWREIVTGLTPGLFAADENGNLIVYRDSDKKIYTFDEATAKESVAVTERTGVFELSTERKEVARYVALTYKSPTDTLTLTLISEDNVPSGSIQAGVTYTNDGYTKVTYNGTDYTDGQTFVCVAGRWTYTTEGTGKVAIRKAVTIPASTDWTTYRRMPGFRAKRMSLQVAAAASTNNVEIGKILIEAD